MWSLFALLLIPGCSTPAPTQPETPEVKAPGKAKGPSKARKSKTKAPPAAPLGVAGPVTGELKLTVVEAAPPPVPPAPPEGSPDAPVTPPAPPAPAAPKTQADLVLTFSDGQSAPVTLGKVVGTCIDAPVTPIGPEGSQQTPLWNVECVDAATTTNLAILQAGDQITVLKAAPAPDGTVAYKPVKRIRLAAGATLTRKSG